MTSAVDCWDDAYGKDDRCRKQQPRVWIDRKFGNCCSVCCSVLGHFRKLYPNLADGYQNEASNRKNRSNNQKFLPHASTNKLNYCQINPVPSVPFFFSSLYLQRINLRKLVSWLVCSVGLQPWKNKAMLKETSRN